MTVNLHLQPKKLHLRGRKDLVTKQTSSTPRGAIFFNKYLSRRTSHETAKISNEAVQGLRRPRCRETARTSQEGIRQDLETQGRRQTIYS